MKHLFIILALAVAAVAAETPTPTIPDKVAANFWRAQLVLTNAQAQVAKAEAAMKQITEQVSAACGDKHTPAMSEAGELVCQPKVEVKKWSPLITKEC